jgi:molybdopterin-guanine dinucleotide biosynthesis adapter protein
MPHIISIVGKSNSGKTTLIEKLLPELKRRGYKIGTIKHSHHAVEIDRKGKDSWRHMAAGAHTVVVASQGKMAMVKDVPQENPDDLECYFSDMDLVITEGFKTGKWPKIEIFRSARNKNLLCVDDDTLVAVVTDADIDLGVPLFGLEDIVEIVDFIEKTYLPPADSP